MFIKIRGFRDAVNKKVPLVEIVYDGRAQLLDKSLF